MFNTIMRFFREDPSRLLYIMVAMIIVTILCLGCSLGKIAFQAEDIKVEKPYVPSTP